MSGFLAQVCAEARDRVSLSSEKEPLGPLRERALSVPVLHAMLPALQTPGISVIAEIKRASPSRGALADIPDPVALARAYTEGGATAISVLTEPRHFLGSLDDLAAVAAAVPVPVLRKDFIVDEYQVWEARAAGAAAVLLIVVALEQDDLAALLQVVERAGLVALLEAHDELEVTRAVGAHEASGITGKPIIGINARDLTTLDVDPDRFEAVRSSIPEGAVAVAESGIKTARDVQCLAAAGADAVLIGETVATAADPAQAVASLLGAGTERKDAL